MTPRLSLRSTAFPSVVRRAGGALALAAGLLLAPAALPAQDVAASTDRALMTREELQTLLARAERAGGDQQRAEVAALRGRLREGDFRVGDKISLRTESSLNLPQNLAEVLNATHTLREGKSLRLPNIPELSLDGVLRSELDSVVNAHLARTLRSVRVDAEPTLQVLVSGPVGKPGYLPVEPDMLVTDVIMAAGPAGNADLRRSVVKRDGKEIVSRDSLQAAIRSGATLDRIDFRSGDELAVGEKSTRNWMTYLSVVSALASVGWLVVSLTR
jgi:protein involved in polysaccharide export with SLBB domain